MGTKGPESQGLQQTPLFSYPSHRYNQWDLECRIGQELFTSSCLRDFPPDWVKTINGKVFLR